MFKHLELQSIIILSLVALSTESLYRGTIYGSTQLISILTNSLIVSNGARGNKPGVNTIYDKDGNMIWQGQLTRGQKAGAFMYGTLALDENGEVYRDPETGEPELINYDFDNTKIWTRKVKATLRKKRR